MKNLKKVLALVLVVATLCGFATSAGATDFSDAASVKNSEAVEVMSALGVIKGYTDGSFKPGNNVTRAEMAKMVTAILNGGEDVGPLYSAANVFTDCGYHWARGYIAYATQVKLVAGIGGGKFNPDGNVTGVEAAKMLLCALGYEPERAGLVGTTWAAKTLSLAREAGLTDGFAANFDFSAPLSRDNAALLMLNALKADMVEYSGDSSTITIDGTEINLGGSRPNTFTGNGAWANAIKDDSQVVQLGEKSFNGDLKLKTTGDKGEDAFGRPSLTWVYNKKDIGTYNNATPVLTYTSEKTQKEIFTDLGVSGTSVSMAEVYTDGVPAGTTAPDGTFTATPLVINKATTTALKPQTGNGTTTEIYEVGDGYRMVVVNEYLTKVASVTRAKGDDARYITVTKPSAYASSFDGKFETEDFAKNDWVLITIADGEVKDVKAADVVENVAVTAYKLGDSVTAGGTKYNYSAKPYTGFTPASKTYTLKADRTYTLYLDSCSNVINVEDYSVANEDYVFVLEVTDATGGTRGTRTVYYVDGAGKLSSATVSESVDDASTTTAGKLGTSDNNKWYTISDDSDHNGCKLFKEVSSTNTDSTYQLLTDTLNGGNAWTLSKSNPKISANIITNDSTTFVLETAKDSFKVYDGISKIPGYEHDDTEGAATKPVYAIIKDGFAKIVYINVYTGAASSSTAADDLVYVISNDGMGMDANGNTCNVLTVIKDGALDTEFYVAENATGIVANQLSKITKTDGNGNPSALAKATGDLYNEEILSNATVDLNSNVLRMNGHVYYVNSDTVVYSVGDSDFDTVTVEELVGEQVNATVYLVEKSDSDNTIIEIYYKEA